VNISLQTNDTRRGGGIRKSFKSKEVGRLDSERVGEESDEQRPDKELTKFGERNQSGNWLERNPSDLCEKPQTNSWATKSDAELQSSDNPSGGFG
jgi:hypothetical protein